MRTFDERRRPVRAHRLDHMLTVDPKLDPDVSSLTPYVVEHREIVSKQIDPGLSISNRYPLLLAVIDHNPPAISQPGLLKTPGLLEEDQIRISTVLIQVGLPLGGVHEGIGTLVMGSDGDLRHLRFNSRNLSLPSSVI